MMLATAVARFPGGAVLFRGKQRDESRRRANLAWSSVSFLKYMTHNLHRVVMLSEAKHLLLYQAYRSEADPSLHSA
ncbi:MAG: hypothetical protein ACRD22_02375 [Terriglobia bacterium]